MQSLHLCWCITTDRWPLEFVNILPTTLMLKQTFLDFLFYIFTCSLDPPDLSISVIVCRRSPDIYAVCSSKLCQSSSFRLNLSQPPGYYSKCADTLPAENRRGTVPCQTPGGRVLTRGGETAWKESLWSCQEDFGWVRPGDLTCQQMMGALFQPTPPSEKALWIQL